MYNPTDVLYTQRCANATNILYTQFSLKIRNSKISSFCYAHKRPSPFFYILPQKTLFSTLSMNLLSNSCQQTGKKSENGKNGPTHKPRYRTSAKISFIIAIQPFHWCRQNARKKSPLLCRLGLVLRLGSV